jgi:glycosyltransferase involved in cell wall biosynthesis
MPFSSGNGKAQIQKWMTAINPRTGLDIGAGSGTYAKLYPNVRWDGVEIWEPYIEKYGLRDLYETVSISDIREWTAENTTKRWNVAIAGDVLEHMTAEEAKGVLSFLRLVSDYVIVSIPIGHYPQEAYEGNPHEAHVTDDWTDESFRRAFGEPLQGFVDGEIGVYLFGEKFPPLKICVYAIAKNEEKFVERFCKSAQGADMVLIADTGSTDRTVTLAKDSGATVHEIHISPWRFDDARNTALALIPKDVDICVSLDLDEELQPGWREEIERVWTDGTTRLKYKFDWGAGIAFYYEKIHGRHGYRWLHPCHEYPVPYGIEEQYSQTDMLLVIHKPDPEKSRGQYLPLLEMSVKEDPSDPRNAFYYARELSFHNQWERSIEECLRYLSLPGANWPNERCYAYRVMARCYSELGDWDNAIKHARLGVIEAPHTREPWCEVGKLAYQRQQWAECYSAMMSALAIEHREWVYTVDPEVWGAMPHDYASIAAWHLGIKEEALRHGQLALDKEPDNERFAANVSMMGRHLGQEGASLLKGDESLKE